MGQDKKTGEIFYVDCSPESPAGRRSLCYDREALDSRKKNKPEGNAVEMAASWGATLLSEAEYRHIGEVTAWHVTLWEGRQMLSEQKSFLW